MHKIFVKYPQPSWLLNDNKSLRSHSTLNDIFYAENDERMYDALYKMNNNYSEMYVNFSQNDYGMTLFVETKANAIFVANLVRNIRVALNNHKRMQARIQ